MSSALDLYMMTASATAEHMVESVKAAFYAGSNSTPTPLAIVGGISGAVMGQQAQMVHHAEQYKHFHGWQYSIIRVIAQRIAGQPVRLAKKITKDDRKRYGVGGMPWHKQPRLAALPVSYKTYHGDLELIDNHELLDAIAYPNPIITRWALLFVTIASLELTGKAYWWCRQATEGENVGKWEIWPLPASWVEAIHTEDKLYDHWDVRPDGMAVPFSVPGDEIAFLCYPDPSNPLGAMSPLQAQARAVVTDEAIAEAQRRAFNNGINPGLALIVGRHPDIAGMPGEAPILTREQRQQLIVAVKQAYRGVQYYDEPLILDGLIKDAKRISTAPREMDFLNSGGMTKERLTQGWGVNPVSMGQLEGANRASSAVADDHFCTNVINPKIALISEILTRSLAPKFGDPNELVIYLEEAHAVDLDYDLALETAMIDRYAMSRNEWRSRHGMPPLVEGNSSIVGGTEILLDVEKTDGKSVTSSRRRNLSRTWAKRLGSDGLKRLWLKQHGNAERAMAKDLKKFFLSMGAELSQVFLDYVRRGSAIEPSILDVVFDQKWGEQLISTSKPHIFRSAFKGAATEWEIHTPRRNSFDAEKAQDTSDLRQSLPEGVATAVDKHCHRLLNEPYWKDMTQGVRDEIAETIRTGIRRGETTQEISDRISRSMGQNASAIRSMRIARTEVTGALNAGHAATREELDSMGLLKAKEWMIVDDADTRAEHKKASGQRVDPDGKFKLTNGEKCEYPGDIVLTPAQRCNCRCHARSVTIAEDF